ncbi:MAG: site-specific integrase [Gallionellaceae bacterium]|jgi:integrase
MAQADINGIPDYLTSLAASLPELPHTVRYYDDFDDCVRSIQNFATCDSVVLYINGTPANFDFSEFGQDYSYFAKHLFFHLISEDLRISTVYGYVAGLRHIDRKTLLDLLTAGPTQIRQVWARLFVIDITTPSFFAVKALLNLFSQHHLCGWSPLYLEFISTALPVPVRDKYSKIRTGDAFLSVEEEAQVVSYMEDMATKCVHNPEQVDDDALGASGMLLCSYLFGMRPYQIAQVTMRDMRIWQMSEAETPSIHITFKMAKQRRQSSAFPMTRRVKLEWSPMIALLYRRAKENGLDGDDRLFQVTSTREVSKAIYDLATQITGVETSAMDFRHTAAQRLVDAGASQEELAEFMGHADITTGLVYFQTSPNQAERVNKALAISSVYQQVAKIAHAQFISPEELASLKEEQQIAGVPHGIPIAGIGGCAIGQPSCPYNPITSCYGCRKFMPVADIELHKRVLKDMRDVVRFFVDASRADGESPAFLQLRRTLVAIQLVVDELEGRN